MANVYMTQKGFEEATERLNYLKTVARGEVSRKIGEARSFGDISENAEYDAAKDEQAAIEGEILELESQLRNVKIISETDKDTSVVKMGFTVKIVEQQSKKEREYVIVGSSEVDVLCVPAKISNESPIGQALLGKRVGEQFSVELPNGRVGTYKVKEIKSK